LLDEITPTVIFIPTLSKAPCCHQSWSRPRPRFIGF